MPSDSNAKPIAQLKQCLKLARDPEAHDEANDRFAHLSEAIADTPELEQILDLLWTEVLAGRRAAAFWRKSSDVEKDMTEDMMQRLIAQRQQYLRLLQEL